MVHRRWLCPAMVQFRLPYSLTPFNSRPRTPQPCLPPPWLAMSRPRGWLVTKGLPNGVPSDQRTFNLLDPLHGVLLPREEVPPLLLQVFDLAVLRVYLPVSWGGPFRLLLYLFRHLLQFRQQSSRKVVVVEGQGHRGYHRIVLEPSLKPISHVPGKLRRLFVGVPLTRRDVVKCVPRCGPRNVLYVLLDFTRAPVRSRPWPCAR